jgi:hypothetical protein
VEADLPGRFYHGKTEIIFAPQNIAGPSPLIVSVLTIICPDFKDLEQHAKPLLADPQVSQPGVLRWIGVDRQFY